ncbi:MAG: molybdopterin synthase catalytic subunit [Planctomycetota bacterium]
MDKSFEPIIQVTTDEIDMRELTAQLTKPDCGAVLTFLGVVRDHADGHAVEEIDYTCYEEMAAKELANVARQSMIKHDVEHVAVVHRIGILKVGEASLGVVVASPHRVEGFACAQMLIDEMKKTVPIWKKEFGPDGTNWVE